ncbi:MAG TPA: FecR domain-containing protein [Polyangiaceae bacterium]|jgi:TolA-binding protein
MSAHRQYRSPDGAARALAHLLREDAVARVASEREHEPDVEHERLLRTAGLRVSHARTPWLGVAALAAALTLLLTGAAWRHAHAALSFAVDGVARSEGALVAAPAGAAVLRFSDGSTFGVEPGAQVRVEASSATGARLALLAGKTVVHVVHREKSSWALSAGPFEVQVTGTRFSANWDANQQRLIVELYEGSVQVVSSSFSAPIAVRTGQRLEAGVGRGDWLVSALTPPPPKQTLQAPDATNNATPAAEPPPAESNEATAPGARAPHAGFDWPTLVQHADFDGIVHQAEDFGIERCLASCAPGDLRILADAARYSGRAALAERSLLALRKRVPSEAATAAFLLARLNESRGSPSEALRWYDEHLREAPSSVYAAEALAGKMRLLQQTGGSAAAHATAEQYLARFPNGVQAAAARRILTDSATR